LRIYAVADLHGRPDKMGLVARNTERLKPDVIVAAGDLTPFLRPRPSLADLGRLGAPVLAVTGNSDFLGGRRAINQTDGIDNLHLKPKTVNGIEFVGLSGTVPVPFRTRVGLWESRLFQRLQSLVNRNSVVVAHPPPFGVLDKVAGKLHAGSSRLRQLLETERPRLFICGHIHEDAGVEQFNDTLVVNASVGRAGHGAVIDLNAEGTINAELITSHL
jgi:Icc-related predicted phosphoesterase